MTEVYEAMDCNGSIMIVHDSPTRCRITLNDEHSSVDFILNEESVAGLVQALRLSKHLDLQTLVNVE